jgi:hypothetical protein
MGGKCVQFDGKEADMRIVLPLMVLAMLGAGLWIPGPTDAQSPLAQFPDVPPWHWAYQAVLKDEQAGLFIGDPASPGELVANSIAQVYAGFAHVHGTDAQAWVERFTYDRPGTWPGPFERSRLVAFALRAVRPVVTGDMATATFTARVTIHTGMVAGGEQTTTGPMQVGVRRINGDWRIDYATLARGSGIFR